MSKILKRSEVDKNTTWDLTPMFISDEEWEKEYEKLSKDINEIDKYSENFTDNLQNFKGAIKLDEELSIRLGKLYVYAHLQSDSDTTNTKYQEYNDKMMLLSSILSQKTTFIPIKSLEMSEEKLNKYLEDEEMKVYKFDFEKLLKSKEHILSQKEEELLSSLSPLFSTPSKAFSMLNNADIKFRKIKDSDGNEYEMSHSRYSQYLESKDRVLRKDAYESMYESFKSLKNTFATTLEGNTKTHVITAKLKKYESARNLALSSNYIDESVYDALLSAVNEKLPLLHKYVDIRKRYLGLDDMAMYDMYVPLVSNDIKLHFTFEEAKEIILDALSILGEDYISVLKKAFSEKWIDYCENEGKRSGAYSSGTYGTNPYILMSYKGDIDNLFTLIHELGHSIHSYYTRNYQPYTYGSYTIFLAEIASITNEMILSDYLMKKYEGNKEVQIYILNHYLDRVKSTLYRQTQFAEFEYRIHRELEEGRALNENSLSNIYDEINRKYYGDAIKYDENIKYEWARIPHFYYNFYVYQYATGISAAVAFAKRIIAKEEGIVDKYIGYLKSGCSDYSINILKKAGLDMSTNKPVLDCLNDFELKLKEFENLILNK